MSFFSGVIGPISGAAGEMTRMQVLSNNLANINNAGFKQDRLLFEAQLDNARQGQMGEGITHRLMTETHTDFSQGNLEYTGRGLDVGIEGEGFFKVATEEGFAYTRHGSFVLQPDGALVTPSGHQVVGESGPVNLADDNVTIGEDGQIIGANGGTEGQLDLYTVQNPQQLEKQGNNLWRRPEDVPEELVEGSSVYQGKLEAANVSAIQMTTDLVEAGRSFESYQKAIKAYDTVAEKTNTVGRIG
ncbi:MAG: flagellar hook-basal body protein [Thermodesulfobacteriota bacterium]